MSTIIDPKLKGAEAVVFTPDMRSEDPAANYWLRQVTVRLRREVAWRWHLRNPNGPSHMEALPPIEDRLTASLDLTRYHQAREAFFREDITGRYLSQKLEQEEPSDAESARGGFGWVSHVLGLDDVSSFALALGIMPCFDSASGPVMGACLNDPARPFPNLALVQRLWDRPEDALALADPSHPLWRMGLLTPGAHSQPAGAGIDWEGSFHVPASLVNQLLYPRDLRGDVFRPVEAEPVEAADDSAAYVADRIVRAQAEGLRIVPVVGPRRADFASAARRVSSAAGRTAVRFSLPSGRLEDPAAFGPISTLAWLRGVDLLLEQDSGPHSDSERRRPHGYLAFAQTKPITVFAPVDSVAELNHLPESMILPAISAPTLDYAGRLEAWARYLGGDRVDMAPGVAECARRYRFERETIRSICEALQNRPGLREEDLFAACRAEYAPDMGSLAQLVAPRFGERDLILPPKQQGQFDEIFRAMRALATVHYGWGTAQVWNEGGISVLFAGAPGTGKTMAAEVLSSLLKMPMYRIDLSQVVNKYIGETEKNLKRLFDAADVSDSILFFDEADSLFGRRTEVKDAHDRYANLEVSYLLERMERFKGLAILATNRRKDLDDAFLRRLRYIVEFPMPEADERKKMWERMIPGGADASEIDFEFLARQFQLAGGHIRSIVFNACLQSAEPDNNTERRPKLTMERIVVAVRREYSKLGRSVSLEQFGRYAPLVEGMSDD